MSQPQKLVFRPSKPIVVASDSSILKGTEISPKPASEIPADESWNWVDEKLPSEKSKSTSAADTERELDRKRKHSETSSPLPANELSSVAVAKTTASSSADNNPVAKKVAVFGSSGTGILGEKRTFGSGLIGGTFSTLAKQQQESSSVFNEMSKQVDTIGDTISAKVAETERTFLGTTTAASSEPLAEISTGEEDDHTIFRARGQLKVFDNKTNEWKQRGTGPVHINFTPKIRSVDVKGRIIMRNIGTLGVILNAVIFTQMSVKHSGEKSLIIGTIENGKISTYAIKFETKAMADKALDAISKCKEGKEVNQLTDESPNEAPYHVENSKQISSETGASNEDDSDEGEGLDDESGEFDVYQPAANETNH